MKKLLQPLTKLWHNKLNTFTSKISQIYNNLLLSINFYSKNIDNFRSTVTKTKSFNKIKVNQILMIEFKS